MWSFTLPFGLVDKLGLMTGPTVGVVAWLMFGVYQIGHTIEDPFQGSLRLSDMCNSIYRDVMYGDRNEAGMRRESAFRKDDEKDTDWDSVGDAFGLGWTVKAKSSMERYTEQLVLSLPSSSLTPCTPGCQKSFETTSGYTAATFPPPPLPSFSPTPNPSPHTSSAAARILKSQGPSLFTM